MNPDHIHFSEWAFMAKADPETFERRRRECIDAWLTNKAGEHRPYLRALQCKIDAERERANSPQEAIVAISEMMCRSLNDLASELKELSTDLKQLEQLEPAAALSPESPQLLSAKRTPLPIS